MNTAPLPRIYSKDELIGRIGDILRRSEVKDADDLVSALDRQLMTHGWLTAEELALVPTGDALAIVSSVRIYGRINVIKAVRLTYTGGEGLREAKNHVDRAMEGQS